MRRRRRALVTATAMFNTRLPMCEREVSLLDAPAQALTDKNVWPPEEALGGVVEKSRRLQELATRLVDLKNVLAVGSQALDATGAASSGTGESMGDAGTVRAEYARNRRGAGRPTTADAAGLAKRVRT